MLRCIVVAALLTVGVLANGVPVLTSDVAAAAWLVDRVSLHCASSAAPLRYTFYANWAPFAQSSFSWITTVLPYTGTDTVEVTCSVDDETAVSNGVTIAVTKPPGSALSLATQTVQQMSSSNATSGNSLVERDDAKRRIYIALTALDYGTKDGGTMLPMDLPMAVGGKLRALAVGTPLTVDDKDFFATAVPLLVPYAMGITDGIAAAAMDVLAATVGSPPVSVGVAQGVFAAIDTLARLYGQSNATVGARRRLLSVVHSTCVSYFLTAPHWADGYPIELSLATDENPLRPHLSVGAYFGPRPYVTDMLSRHVPVLQLSAARVAKDALLGQKEWPIV